MPDYNKPVPPYGPNQCGKLIKMVPYDFTNEIKIIWNLPYFGNNINKMNLKYFVDVFGNEGEGSLLSYLKSEGLATNLVVGKVSVAYCMTKFEVNVDLTEKGL